MLFVYSVSYFGILRPVGLLLGHSNNYIFQYTIPSVVFLSLFITPSGAFLDLDLTSLKRK